MNFFKGKWISNEDSAELFFLLSIQFIPFEVLVLIGLFSEKWVNCFKQLKEVFVLPTFFGSFFVTKKVFLQ